MDGQKFYAAVHAKTAELNKAFTVGFCKIVSSDRYKQVSEQSNRNAARMICENLAVLADATQIADFKARAKANVERDQARAYNREKAGGNVSIIVSRG